MSNSVSFHVYGTPMPKGSTTRMPNGGTIPAGTTASRKRMSEWRTDIRNEAIDAMGEMKPSIGAVRIMMEFQLPYPISSIRKYQFGWLPHTKKPDVDKLMRMMLDALTGIVWKDDSQVCFSTVNKVYSWNNQPGCDVVVDFLDDESMKRYGETHQSMINIMESL